MENVFSSSSSLFFMLSCVCEFLWRSLSREVKIQELTDGKISFYNSRDESCSRLIFFISSHFFNRINRFSTIFYLFYNQVHSPCNLRNYELHSGNRMLYRHKHDTKHLYHQILKKKKISSVKIK